MGVEGVVWRQAASFGGRRHRIGVVGVVQGGWHCLKAGGIVVWGVGGAVFGQGGIIGGFKRHLGAGGIVWGF